MTEYLDLIEDVLTNGKPKTDPQGVGNLSVLGRQVRYDLKDGFPLITTRDMSHSWKAITGELLWIISGNTNANNLHKKYGVKLWNQWATPETSGQLGFTNGELGPIYGHQLRNFNSHVDQLAQVIGMLKRRPDNRRAVITYWNPEDVEINGVEKVFIAPCVAMLHFFHQDGELSLHMFQRAVDLAAGAPFDIAEYTLFLMLVAKELDMKPATLVHTLSDAHIYRDQVPAMKQLLTRQPHPRPTVIIANSPTSSIYNHQQEDFILANYNPHPPIKIPVAT